MFILTGRNNRVENDLFQKIQPKLPSGVQEADHWFEVVQVKSATFLYQECRTHGHDLEEIEKQPEDKMIIVLFSYESAPTGASVSDRRVMAISNVRNHADILFQVHVIL